MKDYYTIYSQRLAGYLMLNGIPLISLTPNSKSGKNMFVFHDSEYLRDTMVEWQNKFRKGRII